MKPRLFDGKNKAVPIVVLLATLIGCLVAPPPASAQFAFFEFGLPTFHAPENGGPAPLSIVRWGNTNIGLSVEWFATSGFAVAGVDFVGVTNTVNFAPGETNKIVTVPILDDGLVEEAEGISLRFGAFSTGSSTGSVNYATLWIDDNEVPSLLDGDFRPSLYPDNDVFTLLVQPDGKILVGGEFEALASGGGFMTRAGIARYHADGSFDSTFLDIVGVASGVYALALQADGKILVGGGFTATGTNPRRYLTRLHPNGALDVDFVVNLNDEIRAIAVQPDGQILIAGRFTTVNNQNRGRIARLNPNGSVDNAFIPGLGADNNIRTMALQADGRILIGGQFTSYSGTTRARIARLASSGELDLSFNPGTGADDQVRAIAVTADGAIYIGGEFNRYNQVTRPALVRLFSDGTLDFAFSASLRTSDTVRNLLMQPDGRLLVGGSFPSAGGVSRQNFARLLTNGAPDVTLLSARGPNDEVFAIALQPNGRILIGGQFLDVAGVPHQHVARLLPDSREMTVEYAASQFFAAESMTLGTISVRRTGQSSNTVGATYFTEDGSAWAGSDYRAVTNIIQFSSLQVTQTFTVPLIQDTLVEEPETVRLLMTNASGALPGGLREAELMVLDGTGVGFITIYPPILEEDGPGSSFAISRSGPTNFPLTLYYRTRDGSAQAGLDYEAASGTFQFAPGETFGYIGIKPINDSLQEPPEDLFLELSETPDGPVRFSSSVSIIDNELGIGFASDEAMVDEDVGTVTLYVSCLWDPAGPIEVDYATRDFAAAKAGLDYSAQSGTLTFTAYGETHPIVVPIINDGSVEGLESFAVQLTALRGPGALSATNAVVTIHDNDYGIEFVTNSVATGESSGNVTLSVQRHDDGPNVVTVKYVTFPDTAAAGSDYAATSGTLVLPPGPDPKSFAVPILNDALIEADETFRVGLRNPSGGVSLGSLTSAVVRILDDERPGSIDLSFEVREPGNNHYLPFGYPKLDRQGDGKILVGAQGALIRLLEDGLLDDSFQTGPLFEGGFSPLVQPDGRILVGATSSNSLVNNQCVIRLLNSGAVDDTFATPVQEGRTVVLALQPDGKIFVGGNYDVFPETPNNAVHRLLSDGSIDATFQAGPFLPRGSWYESPSTVEALLLQPNGRLLVGGKFYNVAGRACDRIIRLNADGSPDQSFFCHPGSMTNHGAVLALALQADGKILVGGDFTSLQGTAREGLTRLHADGTVDTNFVPWLPLSAAESSVRAIEVQPDGKILVGGGRYPFWWEDNARGFVVRLNSDGSLDETFDPGLPPNGAVSDLALLPNGDVLVAGGFSSFSGVDRPLVVRLRGGSAPYSRLALEPTATTVFEGSTASFTVSRTGETNWNTTVGIATLAGSATAGEDFVAFSRTLTFRPGESIKTISVTLPDDWLSEGEETMRLVLSGPGGSGTAILLQPFADITILDNDRPGSLDASFTGGTDPNSLVHAIVPQADGTILVAGTFGQVNGVPGPGYARLNADGSLDTTFQRGTGGYDTVYAISVRSDGRILIGGEFKSVLGEPRVGIARLFADGAVDPSFTSSLDDLGASAQVVNVIAPQSSGRILIGGEFSRVGGQERRNLARLLANGNLDPTFNTPGGVLCGLCGFADTVRAIAPLPNGKILIGGGFQIVANEPRRWLARLNADGTLDQTFESTLNSWVTTILPLANGRILIGGGFTSINGYSRSGIAQFEENGSPSLGLPAVSGTDNTVITIVRQPDGQLIISGYFSSVNDVPRRSIARLNPDLTLDTTFDPGAGVAAYYGIGSITAAALQDDGQVLAGGNFSSVSGMERFNLARLRGKFLPHFSTRWIPVPRGLELLLAAQPGQSYVLEASTDLNAWIPIRTNLATENVLTWIVPAPLNAQRSFYRALER